MKAVNKHIETVALARMQQYSHEVETWLRTLDYLQQENIFLKNRVADLLQYDLNDAYLDKVEYFHNKFLDKDAVLSLLRHDISELCERFQNEVWDESSSNKAASLRRDMEKMEAEFSRLKAEFNKYVFDVFLAA